jgi:anion-transporting  ArsA/GET3 family ATPase
MSVSTHQLLSSGLVMVTGKGGTGKTTIASALALLGAGMGRRTILCEIDNQRSSLQAIFNISVGFEPTTVTGHLEICNIDFDTALTTFVHNIVPIKRIVKKITTNRVIKKFLDFTPGSRELVLMSHLNTLVKNYDLVVVDMPASGHAFSMLDVIRSARGLFRSGPVLALAKSLTRLLESQSARLAFVVLPEEMVVNETLETMEKMYSYRLIGGDPAIFLNKSIPVTTNMNERTLLRELEGLSLDKAAADFVNAGLWESRLESASALSKSRLKEYFGQDPILVTATIGVLTPRNTVSKIVRDLADSVGITEQDIEWP